MPTFLWLLGIVLALTLVMVFLGKEKFSASDPFLQKELAGQKIRYATFGSQQWHIGPPFVPYGILPDQKGPPPSNYCLAEYNAEGRLISLSTFIEGGKEKWKS